MSGTGETTYNAEGRVQGHEDPPLTPLGLRQAELVADRLAGEKLDAVCSSDLVRASATAETIAARHGLAISTTSLLREANLGVVQGLTTREIEERFPAEIHDWRSRPLTARPPGAETTEQVITRCRTFLEGLLARNPDDLGALIVGHGGSMRGLVIAALDLPPDAYHKLRFDNASLSIVGISGRRELLLLNDTCHLDSLRGTDADADSVP